MTDSLNIATEKLYRTFAKYPNNSSMVGCPCCVSDADKMALHSKQLSQLEDEDLSRYAFKAMTTWGDVHDYKHFLPRIFELTAKRQLIVDAFVTLGKLDYAHWKQWDSTEQVAIKEFLAAWWQYDINHAPSFDKDVMLQLHMYLEDLPKMLDLWKLDNSTQGFWNFIEFIEYHYLDLLSRNSSFTEEEFILIKEWIKSKINLLEKAFFKYEAEDNPLCERISNALYLIEHIK